jgi:hypothetical protein
MLRHRPARYRSKESGQFVSEGFAREHPDEAYPVNRRVSAPMVGAVAGGLVGVAALATGTYLRARR